MANLRGQTIFVDTPKKIPCRKWVSHVLFSKKLRKKSVKFGLGGCLKFNSIWHREGYYVTNSVITKLSPNHTNTQIQLVVGWFSKSHGAAYFQLLEYPIPAARHKILSWSENTRPWWECTHIPGLSENIPHLWCFVNFWKTQPTPKYGGYPLIRF